ncbi:uncharacterized protein LOC111022957 [Momordica charantia]|uniref:Uncharacterized protein LOC111022957 n=1 Tax=Momordica charantia TaxID=3673 RepID=A0A6J1DPB7_MOMCH|nr:uncharacterized protein LOC111022957 [Momordica charantia]
MHKIVFEEDCMNSVEPQRRLNPAIEEVMKKEIIKWLDGGIIYPISDGEWVSLVQYVPKKGGMTVIENAKNEFIPTRTVTGWRICMDYRKLNKATKKDDFLKKDHFPLPFIDQMFDRLVGHEYYCFLDEYSASAATVRRDQPSPQLRKMSFHGSRGHRVGALGLQERLGSG